MSLEIAPFVERIQDDSSDIERRVVSELVVLFGLVSSVVRRKTESGFYVIAINSLFKRLH